jgi:hypothetical protein
MPTRYCLLKRSAEGLRYYKAGEGRGWKNNLSEATTYSEEYFAERDRKLLFSREERARIEVHELHPHPMTDNDFLS